MFQALRDELSFPFIYLHISPKELNCRSLNYSTFTIYHIYFCVIYVWECIKEYMDYVFFMN